MRALRCVSSQDYHNNPVLALRPRCVAFNDLDGSAQRWVTIRVSPEDMSRHGRSGLEYASLTQTNSRGLKCPNTESCQMIHSKLISDSTGTKAIRRGRMK